MEKLTIKNERTTIEKVTYKSDDNDNSNHDNKRYDIKNREIIQKDLETCANAIEMAESLIENDFKNESSHKQLLLSLAELKGDLDDQLIRLNKNVYEIAVVGREKSGKSSLLNAWLRFDLLPSERKRCTYTTTEIRSCADISSQKYKIEYFSVEEFENKLNTTRTEMNKVSGDKINRDRELLAQELEEVESLYGEIKKYLGQGTLEKGFRNFQEVKDELKAAISDPGQARAVRKVCIWTPVLDSTENIVLHDVPGYDSPITLHKEQTKAKIASVDAILYAKQFASPDLVDSEVEIMKISDSSNPYIKAKDKIIVSLTCCDIVNSSREYHELVAQNQNAWKTFGVGSSRVVPVCSIAELCANTPEAETVMGRLKVLNGGTTGFKELKSAVIACIVDSKTKIAQDRCNELKNKTRDFSQKLCQLIKNDYDLDNDSQLRDELDDSEMEKIYNEWWAKEWKHIQEDFQIFYQTVIRPKADADAPAFLSLDALDFKKSFEEIVEKTFRSIGATKRERQTAIYISCTENEGIIAPKEGNTKIRIELARESINSIAKITDELTSYLWKSINKMIGWIRNRLWNLPEIRMEMIGAHENVEEKLMKKSFDALIQRLARPATDIFLRYPRSKIERIKVMREYQMELMILDNFIDNGRLTARGLILFLTNGKLGNIAIDFAYVERMVVVKDNDRKIKASDPEYKEEINSRKTIETPSMKNEKHNEEIKIEEKDNESAKHEKSKKSHGFFAKKADKKKDAKIESIQKIPEIPITNERINEENTEAFDNSVETQRFEVPRDKPRFDDDQFSRLPFNADASTLEEIQNEIGSDINEFITCMKNSIFYGSGIQRFYNQELDKYRRKFIELEEDKRRWFHLVSKYIRMTDSKVKIPAPKMADEVRHRKQMIIGINELTNTVNEF